MNALTWLITPAFVATIVFAVLPFYDAPFRWSRRLKSDITIAAGLPEGKEKQRLISTLEIQAERLREYREVWTPARLFWKWATLAACVGLIMIVILEPPINRPGEKALFSPADWILVLLVLYEIAIIASCVGTGLSVAGRTPRQMMINDRIKRHDKRFKRLRRLDRERARLIKGGERLHRTSGSQLGFSTQADPMAGWVRSWEAQSIGRNTSWIAVGISQRAYLSLRDKGIRPPVTNDLHPSWDLSAASPPDVDAGSTS